jgi:hypothetical protein
MSWVTILWSMISNALARIETELPPLPEIQHLVQFIRRSERGISK